MHSFKNIPSPVWSDSAQNQLFFYLNGVWLSPAHVELVVAHAEGEDPLVDPQPRREEHEVRRLRVDRLDHELAVVERNVPVG